MRDKPLLFWWEHEHFCHHWALTLSTSLEVWAPLAHIHLCVCVLGVHTCMCFYECASLHLVSKSLMLWISSGNQSSSLQLWLLPPAWCPLIAQSILCQIPGESGLVPCVQLTKSESQHCPREAGIKYPGAQISSQLRFIRASLVVRLVKILPAMWETQVWSLDWEDLLEKGIPTPVFWSGEFHEMHSPWGLKESDTTERLSLSRFIMQEFSSEDWKCWVSAVDTACCPWNVFSPFLVHVTRLHFFIIFLF